MVKANNQLHEDYSININEGVTISSLAMKLFLSKYYKDNIAKITKPSIYDFIKKYYYGGITEVYRPYGENLNYYDVNSLYPYVAFNDMPGINCKKITILNSEERKNSLDKLFGFFYCKVKSPMNLYIGLLPIKTNVGLEFPLGE